MQQSLASRLPFLNIKSRLRLRWEVLLWAVCTAVALYLVFSPLAMLVFSSFRDTTKHLPLEPTTFTLNNFGRVFGSRATYELLLNSFWYAAGSTVLAAGLSVSLAWLLERTNVPWRPLLIAAVLAPMGLPGVVSAMSWTLMANPNNGLLNVILRGLLGTSPPGPLDIYSIPGMIIVSSLQFVPGMYLLMSVSFSRLDPSLEEASSMSGGTAMTTFRRVTIPLLLPGILAALIFYFVFFVEAFEIPALLGMPNRIFVLSTAVFEAMHPRFGLPDYGIASGYALVTVVLAIALIYVYGRAIRRQDAFAVVTGRAYRPRLIDLGRWRFLCAVGVLLYFVIAVGFPFFILIWTSLLPAYMTPSLEAIRRVSFVNYATVFSSEAILRSIQNTGILAIVTSTGTIIVAAVLAWLSVRGRFPGSRLADRLTFIIFGVPGIVVALALIFIYISLPLTIYGTIWILFIAMMTRFLPYISRTLGPAFLQLHHELEEASAVSGASWWCTMTRVVFPLVRPALARGWLWVFVHVITETGIAVMLFVLINDTVATRLWIAWFDVSNRPFASSIAVLLMLVSGTFTYFVVRWTILRGDEKTAI